MAEQTKVSGSLVLKRLKTGRVVFLSVNALGKPFFQGWNSSSGTAVPDFTTVENQPVATPTVTSSDGTAVKITSGEWKYNDTLLTFGDPAADGWATSTNANGAFAYNPATHELKVVKNVASADNTATDTLTFTAHGEAGGANYTVTGSIELRIMTLGNSANVILISLVNEDGNDTIITGDDDTVKLQTTRLTDGNVSNTGVVKWFGEDGKTQIGETGDTITVTSDDVQGVGIIYARWYASASSATVLASDAIAITDVKDDVDVVVSLTDDSPAEWDGSSTMKVQGLLYKFASGKETTLVDPQPAQSAWTHEFHSSSLDTDCGTISGKNPVEVTKDIWAKVKDFEDLVDFVSCTIS